MSQRFIWSGFLPRLAFLAVLFIAELGWASLAFDGATLFSKSGFLTHLLASWGAPAVRFSIVFIAVLATFSFLDRRAELAAFSEIVRAVPFRWVPLGVHLLAAAAFATLGAALYRTQNATSDLVTLAFLACAILAIASAGLAVLPASLWKHAAAIPHTIWAYAAGGAGLVIAATSAAQSLWLPLSKITFQIVNLILKPFVSLTIVEPIKLVLGTDDFAVRISPECSGLEGIMLLLLIGSLWLILFRKECRFPQALLLLPAGILILFFLNSVRIAALILIGLAGAHEIAMRGFHSQAGWISFNVVSLGLCVLAQRSPWFSTKPRAKSHGSSETEAYLMPFLAILAAGMAARALSAGFEWFYALRLFAPLLVFWIYRRHYAKIDWRPSSLWLGITGGILVLTLWVGVDYFTGVQSATMPQPLRDTSPAIRALWIALRAIAATVTVPIAEELAFRGYLMRRVTTAEFDSLPATKFSWLGLIVSSVVFGFLHGGRWFAGIAAGLIFALIYQRRGRIADAILAHAMVNALLAATVLIFGAWQYW